MDDSTGHELIEAVEALTRQMQTIDDTLEKIVDQLGNIREEIKDK